MTESYVLRAPKSANKWLSPAKELGHLLTSYIRNCVRGWDTHIFTIFQMAISLVWIDRFWWKKCLYLLFWTLWFQRHHDLFSLRPEICRGCRNWIRSTHPRTNCHHYIFQGLRGAILKVFIAKVGRGWPFLSSPIPSSNRLKHFSWFNWFEHDFGKLKVDWKDRVI